MRSKEPSGLCKLLGIVHFTALNVQIQRIALNFKITREVNSTTVYTKKETACRGCIDSIASYLFEKESRK